MPFCFHIVIKRVLYHIDFFRWLVSFSSENTSETYCHIHTAFFRKLAEPSVNRLLLGIFAPAFLTATRPALPFLAIYWCWQLCFLRDCTTFSRIVPQHVLKTRWLPSDCNSDRPSFLIKTDAMHRICRRSHPTFASSCRKYSTILYFRLYTARLLFYAQNTYRFHRRGSLVSP